MLLDIQWWIQNSQIIYNMVGICAFASIIFTVFTYLVYRKQLNIATMSRCIDYYRIHFIKLVQDSVSDKLLKYIDFVNEELFYMENKYIPRKAAFEWISGMIDHVPIFYNGENVNPNKNSATIITANLLDEYPRVEIIFTVINQYDFTKIFSKERVDIKKKRDERKKLIDEILANLKLHSFEFPN